MSFADHFSSVAASYATYRPHYPRALADLLADRCAHHEVAWDAGCGNGQLSGELAARFARVIAQDPSQAQLDAAVPHARVAYACAAAETSGLPDRSVDLAVAAQAAHWFDWPRYVAEVTRVARPGALAALVSYGIVIVDGAAGDVIARYYHDDAGPFWPPNRKHVENGYRDLVWPWPALDAPALAMTARWTRDELFGYVTTWSATVKLVDTKGRGPLDTLHANLAAVWPANEARDIRWPLTLRLGTVSS